MVLGVPCLTVRMSRERPYWVPEGDSQSGVDSGQVLELLHGETRLSFS